MKTIYSFIGLFVGLICENDREAISQNAFTKNKINTKLLCI